MHQDAHEFLNYLVNSVVENMEEEERLERQKAPVEDCTLFFESRVILDTDGSTSINIDNNDYNSLTGKIYWYRSFERNIYP